MSGYVLYGDIRSGSAAVEMALAEAGAAVELRSVPLSDGAQGSAEFLRLNPAGRIPVLVLPDGTVLTESVAILLTVCDLHPGAGLLPAPGTHAWMTALRWMAAAGGEAYPAVTRDDYPERFSPDPAAAPGIRAVAQEHMRRFWRRVDEEAGPDPFLAGAFSVADIYLAVMSRWAVPKPWFGPGCPGVDRMAAAVASRPACAPVWQRHFPG